MALFDIADQRLHHQHIAQAIFELPGQVVAHLGAVQAQDYAAAKWALGLRAKGVTEADIEKAFADGVILRTHVLRPTWHFVTPADICWMLALTAPRVNRANAYYYRNLGLDDATFARSNTALEKALQGGKQLVRTELRSVLQQAGITTQDLGFTYLIMRAELDGAICSGARQSKQFTYALLKERAPQARILERDEALSELARRYFTSRGPATLQDFIWWSGLATADARIGLEMFQPELEHELINGQTYWFTSSAPPAKDNVQAAYLLPNFDEYSVGYTDRSAIFHATHADKLDSRAGSLLNYVIIVDGRVVGFWKRTLKKSAVVLELKPFTPLTEAENGAVAAAAQKYGAFLGLPVVLA